MEEWELYPLIIDSSVQSSFVAVFSLLDQRFLDLRACDPLKMASCPFSSPPPSCHPRPVLFINNQFDGIWENCSPTFSQPFDLLQSIFFFGFCFETFSNGAHPLRQRAFFRTSAQNQFCLKAIYCSTIKVFNVLG